DPKAGEKYAVFVAEAIEKMQGGLCGFLHESMPSSAGQIVFPEGYLREVYRLVRDGGGVCIADEVQTGFGRLGTHFWGFQTQDVIPDIVTLGKPIGNGHPLGAVITTREIADSFAKGMEFFSTFGGNPVSCAIGLAVLDVIAEEKLQQNAKKAGDYLLQGLHSLREKHPLIGDVRGMGFYIGVELVTDRHTLAPALAQASDVVNRMKDRGVLISTDGIYENVLKIRPPMVFNTANADFLIANLDVALAEPQR
ncbi:MAG TPA: aminotransferase class III-fold pyridoxal phosphate-dependent enzyme, partial [Acidobacteriota bacterium]|nr:aminotransferase class III-fold pyridoxal phosphate-dependent enzyme [Acidobacteriota bacterium]